MKKKNNLFNAINLGLELCTSNIKLVIGNYCIVKLFSNSESNYFTHAASFAKVLTQPSYYYFVNEFKARGGASLQILQGVPPQLPLRFLRTPWGKR